MKDRLVPVLAAAAIFIPMMFSHSCANTTQAPTGGPKDTIPPVIRQVTPASGITGVPLKGFKIVLKFNEYCVIKNQQNILLSPPQIKPPVVKVKGKSIEISFEEEFLPSTTYSLSFDQAIADNNEGNLLPGFTYVFSTGDSIDSLYITGTVLDSKKMEPVKDATVLLYKDHSDSAVLKSKPFAAAKTDSWGYFSIAYIKDTSYRLYAIEDKNSNSIYDPDAETIAFLDTVLTPRNRVVDSLPELTKYEAKDTALCLARKSEYNLVLFREKPVKQFVERAERTSEKNAYVKFFAPNVWIDSLWIAGYPANHIITEFNSDRDSIAIWVNDRRPAPDTLHLFVSYRKTDMKTGDLVPDLEHLPLVLLDKDGKPVKKKLHQKLEKQDTTCAMTVTAVPEKVEYKGIIFDFKKPIVEENFSKFSFVYRNAKQKEFPVKYYYVPDSTNLLRYVLWPETPFQQGVDYFLKIPQNAFRDMDGWYTDSLDVKFSLPNRDNESSLVLSVKGTSGSRYYFEVLNDKMTELVRDFWIEEDADYEIFYLKAGKYRLRITEDSNRNGKVDTGSLMEHRQPEKVRFYQTEGNKDIPISSNSEVTQDIDLTKIFAD